MFVFHLLNGPVQERPPISLLGALRASTVVASIALISVASLPAATPLFPHAFHVVREIDDSLAAGPVRVDEYYAGDLVITIRREHTAIADYGRQELTEIDRDHGTYSTASFAEVASALPDVAQPRARLAGDAAPSVIRKGAERRGGREVDVYDGEDPRAAVRAEVSVDAQITLTRDAFDVVAGGAFPRRGGPALELLRKAALRSGTDGAYGLPLEHKVEYRFGGETVKVASRIVSVDEMPAPNELVTIPPGSRRIESHSVEMKRIVRDSDTLVPAHPEH